MVDSSDHVSGKTGLTLTITASKDGAAFGSISPSVTDLGSGWYKLALTTSHTDTLGDLAIHITSTGADPTDLVDEVVVWDPATAWLSPTVAGRTLDVSAGGEAGVDWANIGSPTTSNALTGTTIATTQKVDVETIKTNPVVNGGTVTFPTTATLASTTNITAGTITTATNVTTVNGLAAGVITATSIASNALTAAKIATDAIGAAQLATDAVTEIQSGLATASALSTVAGYIDTEVATIVSGVAALQVGVTVTTNNDKTGYRLSATGVDDIHDEVVEGSTTLRQGARLWNSAAAGKLSGAATTTVNIRDLADTKNRVSATVDSSGNRSAVTTDVT